MKNIAVLGVCGSIGLQTLDIIENNDNLKLYAVALDKNIEACAYIANKFKPNYIALRNAKYLPELRAKLCYSPEIITGDSAAAELCKISEVDIVVNAVAGFAGFLPLVTAIENKKTIAAANKESIVCAHKLFEKYFEDGMVCMTRPFPNGARIIPVDSEQSAIFQCLRGENPNSVKSLILTASGGAFIDASIDDLKNVTAEQAMTHPTWRMGKKITIDSATLFNKGLEVMEAAYLFGVDAERVEVCIHRQSVVHSMVRFQGGSVKAQLAVPDMRGAIAYALEYPARLPNSIVDELDFSALTLTFCAPDTQKYRSLPMAYSAFASGGVYPVVYNAANEAAVEMFTDGKISFMEIFNKVEYALTKSYACTANSVDDIMEADRLARIYVTE